MGMSSVVYDQANERDAYIDVSRDCDGELLSLVNIGDNFASAFFLQCHLKGDPQTRNVGPTSL
jgi:hypothetical protein